MTAKDGKISLFLFKIDLIPGLSRFAGQISGVKVAAFLMGADTSNCAVETAIAFFAINHNPFHPALLNV
jgi:hypothetical protein